MARKHFIVGVAQFIRDQQKRRYASEDALEEAIQFARDVNAGIEQDGRGFTIDWSDSHCKNGDYYRTENVYLTPSHLATAIGLATYWSKQPRHEEPVTLEQYQHEQKVLRSH